MLQYQLFLSKGRIIISFFIISLFHFKIFLLLLICTKHKDRSVTSRSFRKLGQTDQPTTGRRTDRVIEKLQAKNLHTYIPFFVFVIIFKVELIGIYICMNTSKSAIKLYSIHRLLEINNNDNNGKKREGGGVSTYQTYV